MSLFDRISALLNYANETTGKADTTLGDAVRTLADGYGQGGGGGFDEEGDCGFGVGRAHLKIPVVPVKSFILYTFYSGTTTQGNYDIDLTLSLVKLGDVPTSSFTAILHNGTTIGITKTDGSTVTFKDQDTYTNYAFNINQNGIEIGTYRDHTTKEAYFFLKYID